MPSVKVSHVGLQGKAMPAGPGEGILVIDRPWPSMMRTLRGDHERFEKTYFPTGEGFAGKYFTGESPAHSL